MKNKYMHFFFHLLINNNVIDAIEPDRQYKTTYSTDAITSKLDDVKRLENKCLLILGYATSLVALFAFQTNIRYMFVWISHRIMFYMNLLICKKSS